MSKDERRVPGVQEGPSSGELDLDALPDISGGTPGWVSPKPTVVTTNG
jgi:hypothetical protein